jgi:anti-sigma regulatory factor (Ser/Thr protein kinase)
MKVLVDQDFKAETSDLAAIRATVAGACSLAGCSEDCSEQMVLAVNEAAMNIIQHGYKMAAGQVFRLRILCDDSMLLANLLDNAQSVSARDLQPRDLADLRPGGLGVRFMQEVTDVVEYLPPPAGYTNCLQILKRIF